MRGVATGLIWELKRHPFFEAISEDKLKGLLDRAQPVVFGARKQIFAQGDDSDSLFSFRNSSDALYYVCFLISVNSRYIRVTGTQVRVTGTQVRVTGTWY